MSDTCDSFVAGAAGRGLRRARRSASAAPAGADEVPSPAGLRGCHRHPSLNLLRCGEGEEEAEALPVATPPLAAGEAEQQSLAGPPAPDVPRIAQAQLPTGVSGPIPRMCGDPRDSRSYHEARRLQDAIIQPGAASNRLDWLSPHPDLGAGVDADFQLCGASDSRVGMPRRNFPRMNFDIYFADEDLEDLISSAGDSEKEPPTAELNACGLDNKAAVSTKRMNFKAYFGNEDIESILARFSDAEIAAAAGEETFLPQPASTSADASHLA